MSVQSCILDTDIGDGIDDVWALTWLLRCERLQLQLVLTSCGDSEQLKRRAQVAAKLVAAAGASHVPIVPGVPSQRCTSSHAESYFLTETSDELDSSICTDVDPAQALHDAVEQHGSEDAPVVIICIGAATTLAATVDRFGAAFASKARIVGMYGREFDPERHEQAKEEGWPMVPLSDGSGHVLFNDVNSKGDGAENLGAAVAAMIKTPFASVDLCTGGLAGTVVDAYPTQELGEFLCNAEDTLIRTAVELNRQYEKRMLELWPGYAPWSSTLWDATAVAVALQLQGGGHADELPKPLWVSLKHGDCVARVAFKWAEEDGQPGPKAVGAAFRACVTKG